MDLVRVIYSSRPSADTDYAEKLEIVADAAKRNGKKNITGYILLADGLFLQALEGETKSVEKLLEKIEGDPRHDTIQILSNTSVAERLFSQWSMGFAHAEERLDFINQKLVDLDDPAHIDPVIATQLLSELASTG